MRGPRAAGGCRDSGCHPAGGRERTQSVRNGGTGLPGASVHPATPELLEWRSEPVVTVCFVTGPEAAVTCVAFPACPSPPPCRVRGAIIPFLPEPLGSLNQLDY